MDLNRTALLLLADHGLHLGLYPFSAANGWVEMSNPLAVLTLPRWSTTAAQRDALRANEQRVTTHQDTYETLRVLAGHADGTTCSRHGIDLASADVGADRDVGELRLEKTCMCEFCELFV